MNRYVISAFTAIMLLLAGVAAAQNLKVDVCHNGSTINPETMEEEAISFVINISENAVDKHIANHGDCAGPFGVVPDPGMECEFSEDGGILVCEEVTLCECLDGEA